ncbi:MAG: hypothetical protein EOO15_18560 [Chitinophagaceae bacterium]|nr:MAG: hypothetical protein EOO15_18560 [Chitinophagaceae bacterium]
MIFYPHVAVEVPRQSNGLIAADKASLAGFWAEIDEGIAEGLSGAIGCYIFSIRAGKGSRPWYVGLAEKQSFKKECFTPHKINHYNNAIASRKGTPMLTLLAKYTRNDKLVSPTGSSHRDIQNVETMLIANCLRKNPDLLNMRDTKLLREMIVRGMLNDVKGKPTASIMSFKTLIGA